MRSKFTAYLNDAMGQLEGQLASAKVVMARLFSQQLYYVLSENDFILDINHEALGKEKENYKEIPPAGKLYNAMI
ncbi:hypothetical protein [Flavobacterium sp. 3-210]